MKKILFLFLLVTIFSFNFHTNLNYSLHQHQRTSKRPNIILIMSDDQGWGQTGYNHHPILKTPNLDEMAAHGLRLDRFYAGAPVCSPTRASVLTGRSNDRSAVLSVGFPMCRQEKTIPQVLKNVGYHTAHFGKWHLDGLKGAGVPMLATDNRNPGYFGFDEWLSTSNYFDMNPLLSRKGIFEEFKGGSSEILVHESLKYIQTVKDDDQPFFIAIWFGSPHGPWTASEEDKKSFSQMDSSEQNHYGELVEMDRNIGVLRKTLRSMGIADNTMLWFNSDNGGLKNFGPETVGGLRGFKGDVYEGGIRVPCIIEWPAVIKKPRVSDFPASTMDIFPTIADVVGISKSEMISPLDGISIRTLFSKDMESREQPIPFRYMGKGAFIDNNYKLVIKKNKSNPYELYDLKNDPNEKNDLIEVEKGRAVTMIKAYTQWASSVDNSLKGSDYPGGLKEPHPAPRFWYTSPEYKPYLDMFSKRPEYKNASAIED